MGAFDHRALDDVIHGRLRLGVMAYLSTAGEASFGELKAQVAATDGNLSAHLSKLEEAGYVAIAKSFQGKRTATIVSITDRGREAWETYLSRLQAMLKAAG